MADLKTLLKTKVERMKKVLEAAKELKKPKREEVK